MTRIDLFAASALALVAVPVAAQSTAQFDPARLARHIQTLGSDAFEGRGPATRAETKTVDYLIREFRAAGLSPGGELVNGKRQWTQAVPLLESDIAGTPQLQLKIGNTATDLVQGEQIAVRAPMNGASAVNLKDAPLLFVGYGVTAPERGWDDFKCADVRGKILVVLINDPDFEGGEGDFGGKAMTYYGRWTYKYEEAARRGAAGVLVDPRNRARLLRLEHGQELQHQHHVRHRPRESGGGAHPVRKLDPARPRGAAVQGFGPGFRSGQGGRAAQGFPAGPAQRHADRQPHGQDRDHQFAQRRRPAARQAHPDETVIYSAHWDHLGIGKPDANGDKIYNGAVDNGTGIAQLIEQGRAFAHEPRTDRSVVFLAVTVEEKGLLGSEYYALHPLYPLAKTVAVLNTDSLGVWGPARNFSIRGTRALGLLDDLIEEGNKQGRCSARPASRNRRLLPLRPFLLRQGRRSRDQLRIGQRSRHRRHRRAARRCRPTTPPSATTSPTTNIRRAGTSAASSRTRRCCTRSGGGWRSRANGRTGAMTANSAPSATSPQANARAPRRHRPCRHAKASAVERNVRVLEMIEQAL